MSDKLSQKITALLFLLMIFGFSLYGLLTPDAAVTRWERRKLAQLPTLTAENLWNGNFFRDFDQYTTDQFPARDALRGLNAHVRTDFLRQQDNKGLYVENNVVYKSDYPINPKNIEHFVGKTNDVYEKYIRGKAANYYAAVIPDKTYFDVSHHLTADAAAIAKSFSDGLTDALYVDIFPALNLASYYRTDTHWSQDKLFPVMDIFTREMQLPLPETKVYLPASHAPFYGVYWGQSALNPPPDTLIYLESPYTAAAKVRSLDKPKLTAVYDLDALGSEDDYNLFSGGGTALITLESPTSKTDRELVLFRDSFGSSLAPLFLEQYRSVTLVDLRYFSSALLPEYVDFTGKDVLVLYSSLILNSSIQLK